MLLEEHRVEWTQSFIRQRCTNIRNSGTVLKGWSTYMYFWVKKKPMFVNQHKDISRELTFDLMSLNSQNKWTNYHKLAVIIFYSFLQKYSLYLCKKWAFYWMIWICWVNACWLCIMFLSSSLLTQRMPQHCTSKMTVCREKHSTGSYKIFIRVGADKEWVHE